MNIENQQLDAISGDLYFVPYQDDLYILYRPSIHSVSVVNTSAVNAISAYLNGDSGVADFDPIINELHANGVLNPPQPVFDTCTPLVQPHTEFEPMEVTLDITWRCNLHCVYCYANAGEKSIDMDWDCATAAINLCVNNCKKRNKPFVLRFHGNGEATQNWKMLTKLVDYGRNETSRNSVRFSSSIATNGIVNQKQAEWIASNIDAISLSYDGNMHSQNSQRPTASGESSSQIIEETMTRWVALGKQFNIRATVTKSNVNTLSRDCLNLGKLCPNSLINVEPMVLCGRANESTDLVPDAEQFADNYVAAFLAAAKNGVRVSYSGIRGFTMRRYFCGASMPNFSVLADGRVTSCFSYSSQDFRRDLFVYGNWNGESKQFEFDSAIISQLRNLSVEHDSYCDNCFVKYHCTGDCPAIRKYDLLEDQYFVEKFDPDFGKNRRCNINRSIMKKFLVALVQQEGVDV